MNNTLSGVICIIQSRVVLQCNNWNGVLLTSYSLPTPFWQNVQPFFVFQRVQATKATPAIISAALSTHLFFVDSCQCGRKFPCFLTRFFWCASSVKTRSPTQDSICFFSFSSMVIFLLSKMATKCFPLISYLAPRAEDAGKDAGMELSFTKYWLFQVKLFKEEMSHKGEKRVCLVKKKNDILYYQRSLYLILFWGEWTCVALFISSPVKTNSK